MNAFGVVWCPLFIFLSMSTGVENMKPSLQDQLKEWQHKHHEPTPKKTKAIQPPPPKKKTEELSERDLAYLMGTGRQILYRRKGALKQK